MTEEKLDEITGAVRITIFHALDYTMTEDEEKRFELIDIIASLHNELYKEVTGKYYNYMYHWANLGYGGNPDDALFKSEEEKRKQRQEEEAMAEYIKRILNGTEEPPC